MPLRSFNRQVDTWFIGREVNAKLGKTGTKRCRCGWNRQKGLDSKKKKERKGKERKGKEKKTKGKKNATWRCKTPGKSAGLTD